MLEEIVTAVLTSSVVTGQGASELNCSRGAP